MDNYIPDEITSELLRKGIYDTIFFYDVDHNLDIEDDSSALAHSAFLAEYFNKFMEKSMKHIQRVFLKAYNPDAESETLAEPLSRALEELPTLDVILVDHFLRTHTEKNVSLQRYYGKILDRI